MSWTLRPFREGIVERVREIAVAPELRRAGPGNAPGSGRLGEAGGRALHRSRRRALLPPGRKLQGGADQRPGLGHRLRGPCSRARGPARSGRVDHAGRHLRHTNMPTAVIGERIAGSLPGLTRPLADGGGLSVPA